MKEKYFFLLLLAVFICFPFSRTDYPRIDLLFVSIAEAAPSALDDGWVVIPAGGKPAYMGIHGGTMPVSLLVSGDGSSLFSFVGRTGNDFLDVLRKVYLPLPGFGNSTGEGLPHSDPTADLAKVQTGIFAGNATATMPVIALSTDLVANRGLLKHLLPFGLSEEPLSIEGQVTRPEAFSPVKKYRNFFMPDYFRTGRGGK